jgi:hypothetical protein
MYSENPTRVKRTTAHKMMATIEAIAKRSSQALWWGPGSGFGVDDGTRDGRDVEEGTAVDDDIDVGIAVDEEIENDVSDGIDMREWVIEPEIVLKTAELTLAVVE